VSITKVAPNVPIYLQNFFSYFLKLLDIFWDLFSTFVFIGNWIHKKSKTFSFFLGGTHQPDLTHYCRTCAPIAAHPTTTYLPCAAPPIGRLSLSPILAAPAPVHAIVPHHRWNSLAPMYWLHSPHITYWPLTRRLARAWLLTCAGLSHVPARCRTPVMPCHWPAAVVSSLLPLGQGESRQAPGSTSAVSKPPVHRPRARVPSLSPTGHFAPRMRAYLKGRPCHSSAISHLQ
jgi:hypothetical protein